MLASIDREWMNVMLDFWLKKPRLLLWFKMLDNLRLQSEIYLIEFLHFICYLRLN